jgi:periplasmic copper chaperone A
MKLVLLLSLTAAGLATAAPAHDFAKGPLKIDHPWSRATAPKAPVGAGFLTIQNFGKSPDRLVAIKSPISDDVEIHTMSMTGGVMKMRELKDGLTIAPGAEVKLQPGAEHIMFMGLKGQIKQGEDFTATLIFERAGEVEVTFKVEPAGANPVASGHAH